MNKLYRLFLGIVVLSAVLISGCTGSNTDKSAETDPGTEEVSVPPAEEKPSAEETSAVELTFEGTDMEGNTVSSAVLSQSKLTMINVWATFCGPCLREMPYLGELASEYDAEEFQIIGIVSDVLEGEDQSEAERLIRQTGANYTHLLLNESIYYALLTDVTQVPTTFFVDEGGTILGVDVGAKEKSAWEEIINGFLEEP